MKLKTLLLLLHYAHAMGYARGSGMSGDLNPMTAVELIGLAGKEKCGADIGTLLVGFALGRNDDPSVIE